MADAPAPVVEPWPLIRNAFGDESVEIAEGALKAKRRRMNGADRGKAPVTAFEGEHADPGRALLEQRQMNRAGIAP
jgi:hypothetical protein